MTAERFEPFAEAPTQPRKAYEKPRHQRLEKSELPQDQREHLCREAFIQGIMGTEHVSIEHRKTAADYIRENPNQAWRQYGNGMEVDEAWVEGDVWHFVFECTEPGERERWRREEKIPLSKE